MRPLLVILVHIHLGGEGAAPGRGKITGERFLRLGRAKIGITEAYFQGSMHFGGHASLCAVMTLGGQQLQYSSAGLYNGAEQVIRLFCRFRSVSVESTYGDGWCDM